MLDQKYCPGCQKRKPFSEFPRNRRRKNGLADHCRACFAFRKRLRKAGMPCRTVLAMRMSDGLDPDHESSIHLWTCFGNLNLFALQTMLELAYRGNKRAIARLVTMRRRLESKLTTCALNLLKYMIKPPTSNRAETRSATLTRRFQELERIIGVLNAYRTSQAG